MERTDFANGEELKIYRRWRAGQRIAQKYRQYFARLTPNELDLLEELVEINDDADREMLQARKNGIAVIDNGTVFPPIVRTRSLARRRGAGRPGHRRMASSRGDPDDSSDSDGPGEAGTQPTALWRIYERLIASLVGLVLTRFRLEAGPA